MRFLFGLLGVLATSNVVFAAELVTITGKTMGTTYSVKYLPGESAEDSLQDLIDGCLVQVNRQMSTWDPESEISRFNQSDSTEWFPVSQDTAFVVQSAIAVSETTGGAFDVTVGPLVNLWKFGPETESPELPTEAEIATVRSRVGYQKLSARLDPPALKKVQGDIAIDLSAIAKGFGVDKVAGVLDQQGIENYMVEIGGEVRTRGQKPDGNRWRIGIESPTAHERGLHQVVELDNQAMATSGDYRNFREINGKTYSHTIDPRTGKPVEHQLTSASVLANNCMMADAYATALMVLGPEEGLRWAKEQNLAVFLIARNGDSLRESSTPAFQSAIVSKQAPGKKNSMAQTWILTAGFFLAAVVLMSVGVILSNRRITGSCGGLAGLKDETGRTMCDACTNPAPECQGQMEAADQPAGCEEETSSRV